MTSTMAMAMAMTTTYLHPWSWCRTWWAATHQQVSATLWRGHDLHTHPCDDMRYRACIYHVCIHHSQYKIQNTKFTIFILYYTYPHNIQAYVMYVHSPVLFTIGFTVYTSLVQFVLKLWEKALIFSHFSQSFFSCITSITAVDLSDQQVLQWRGWCLRGSCCCISGSRGQDTPKYVCTYIYTHTLRLRLQLQLHMAMNKPNNTLLC